MKQIVHKQFGKSFGEKVVEGALAISKGRVTTYGLLARQAGGGGQAARSVSAILTKYERSNPGARIPWHRIVYANGRVWFGKDEGARRKLYKQEGIQVNEKGKIINFYDILYTFE